VLDEIEEGQRRLAVAVEQWEERVEHLRSARLVTLPARRCLLAHHGIDLQRQLEPLFVRFGGSATAAGAAAVARIRGRLL